MLLISLSSTTKSDIKHKLSTIENLISLDIVSYNYILHGLAKTIAQYHSTLHSEKIIDLLNNFDPRLVTENYHSVTFNGLALVDNNGNEIFKTIIPSFDYIVKNKSPTHKKCIEEAGKDYFALKVSQIREGTCDKEIIIPLNIAISNSKNIHIATICSGISVKNLEEKLISRYSNSHYQTKIKILKHNSQQATDIEGIFSATSFLMNLFKNENIKIYADSQAFPFGIEIEINPKYYNNKSKLILAIFLIGTITFIFLVLYIRKITNHYFNDPLILPSIKLTRFNESISGDIDFSKSYIKESFDELDPISLAKNINYLIDCHYTSILQNKSVNFETLEIRKKILNLLLLEKHFLNTQTTKISDEKLYLGKLISVVDEKPTTIELDKFIEQISLYCCEYFECSISVRISNKDKKPITVKHSALTESIFNIFSLIMRGKFETEDRSYQIQASFRTNNSLPTIIIEGCITNSSKSLGWELGPSYIYSNLLTIFLLAKENNLFFNIEKKDTKIMFILEPVEKKIEFFDQAFNLNPSIIA